MNSDFIKNWVRSIIDRNSFATNSDIHFSSLTLLDLLFRAAGTTKYDIERGLGVGYFKEGSDMRRLAC